MAFKLRTTPGTITRGSVIFLFLLVGGAQDTGKKRCFRAERLDAGCVIFRDPCSNSPRSNWSTTVLLTLPVSFFEIIIIVMFYIR